MSVSPAVSETFSSKQWRDWNWG